MAKGHLKALIACSKSSKDIAETFTEVENEFDNCIDDAMISLDVQFACLNFDASKIDSNNTATTVH